MAPRVRIPITPPVIPRVVYGARPAFEREREVQFLIEGQNSVWS